jgi:hypothetical protein
MPDTIEAPPAAPAATPPAAPETPSEQPKGFDEAFGAIDALAHDEGTPDPERQPPASDGRTRGPDGKFLPKPADKPPEKPVEKPVEKPNGEDIDPSKLKTSELAKHYHALKAKEKEWQKQREDYEKKLKTPPEWPEKKTYEEKLAEREKFLAERDKRIADYETELQFTNFTKSQHYKDNFVKPYNDSWIAGQKRAESLKIVERKNEEDGTILQPARKATADDFDAIMSIFDDDAAAEKAAELFGPTKAPLVLYHREQVMEKQGKANAAIKEYQEKGATWEKQRREQSEKASKEIAAQIDNFRQAAVEKYPKFFKPDPEDPEGNKYLESGNHLVERVMKGGAPLKDGEQQMSNEEMAIAVAAVRNKAAAFDRVAYKASSLAKRVKALETELAQYKASVPGDGNGKGRETPPEEESAEQKIWKMGRNVG